MKVSVSPAKGLSQSITITVPNKTIQPAIDKKLQEAALQVNLPGFRPGKAPLKMVRQRFGGSVRHEVINDVMNKTYFEALQKEKLKPAGMPEIEILKDKEGEDLEYKATFDVLPEVELKGLEKIEVDRWQAEVTDKDLSEMMELLRQQHVEWKSVARAAKDGDQVKLDFEGSIDGKPFDGGKAADFDLVLGSNSMIPGFESGLMGVKPDDKKTLKIDFPKDYHAKTLAGKAAEFKVKIKRVSEPQLPALDAKFAKKFKVKDVAELKQEIRNNMARELENNLKGRVKNQVIEGLLKHNKVEIPQSMLAGEINNLRQQAVSRMGQQSGKHKQPELPDALFQEQAERRVVLGLLLAKLIDDHKMKPDEKRVKAMLQQLASVYEQPETMIKQYESNPQQMSEIRQVVLEEQVIDKILESAKVKETQKTFAEVMKPEAAQQ